MLPDRIDYRQESFEDDRADRQWGPVAPEHHLSRAFEAVQLHHQITDIMLLASPICQAEARAALRKDAQLTQ